MQAAKAGSTGDQANFVLMRYLYVETQEQLPIASLHRDSDITHTLTMKRSRLGIRRQPADFQEDDEGNRRCEHAWMQPGAALEALAMIESI